MSSIVKNKKGRHNYEIVETWETGLVLVGTEVKSLRQNKPQIAESYANVKDGEVWLYNLHIPHFAQANRQNHAETRPRKLLMHRREIDRIIGKIKEKGLTLVPLALYWKNNRVKLELGLGRGKKMHDKREDQKKKDAKREIDRALKGKY